MQNLFRAFDDKLKLLNSWGNIFFYMTKLISMILAILGSVLVGGESGLENKLENALKQELGERVKKVEVQVHQNPGSFILKGKIASIDFIFDDLYVKPVLMDEVTFNVKDVRVDILKSALTGDAKVKRVGDISYSFTIKENQLAKALENETKAISDANVKIAGGELILSGKYRLGFLAIPFSVAGVPGFEENRRLVYKITEVRFVGMKLPKRIDTLLEEEINPVFDIEEFYEKKSDEWNLNEEMLGRELKLTVTSISADKGRIVVTGTV